MIKKCVLFTIFLFNSSFLIAQEKTGNKAIDSLISLLSMKTVEIDKIKIHNLIAHEYIDFNPSQGIIYANKGLQLSEKIKWNDGIALSFRNIGQNYVSLGNFKKADLTYERATIFAESKVNIAKLFAAKGALELKKSNFSKALDYFFKSLKINEEIKNNSAIAESYAGLSLTYSFLRENKKSLFYNKKSLLLNEKLNLKGNICENLILMGNIYRDDNKQYTLALTYFFKALEIATKIENKNTVARLNSEIVNIYQFQDKYDLALKHIYLGKKASQETNDFYLINSLKLQEGLIYLLQFEQDSLNSKKKTLLAKAETLLFEAFEAFKKSKDNYNISVCYDTLTYLYQLQNKDKEATLMALKFAAIKDSIFSEKSKQTIKNLEDQRTIELKNKQIEINKITLDNQEKQKWFYVTGIGLLCIVGGLLFYQSRNRKKTNQKLQSLNFDLDQANKTKIQFLSILNHDLRSPVYNFIHFMQLQKESPELLDKETKNDIETKTISSAENLLASMEDLLLWSKGQMDNFKPQPKTISVQSLFDDTKNHFASEEKMQILFENPNNIQIVTDENFLKTIVRNLTGNAIKALDNRPNATIVWRAYMLESKTYLSITDNGSGANQDQLKALYDDTEVVGIKTGLGLHLIRDLAKAIDCDIKVDSKEGLGTTFVLKL
jgi:signal transduction histidine kinase